MKKQVLILIAITLIATGNLGAQSITVATYTFSRSGFAPAALTGPTTLIGAAADNVASPVTDIGFTFWFAGTPYTQFSVSENGLMTLGDIQITGTDYVNDMTSGTTIPKIAPYWDDLSTGTNGSVVYSVGGTAPNRILYINWNVTIPKNIGNTANSLFQVQLSETTGLITFTYGTPAMPANANQYSIGIGAGTTDFASVTVTGTTTATVAYGTANNSNTLSIGAYSRFSFTTDKVAPTITGTIIPNTAGTGNRTCLRTIGDAKTGVPLTGDYIPRIYFKKSTESTYVSSAGVLQSGTSASGSWLFTIDHSLLGGANEGDIINYFVVAQDQSTTTGVPNVSSLPAGVIALNVNSITTPPATPSSYIIGASFSGIKTVGTGGDYPSLTLAGGLFDQINAGQLTGNLTINIISNLSGETGTIPLNAWVNAAGGPYTVTIKPDGGARTITGTGTLYFNGVQGLLVDGLNDGTNSLGLGGVVLQGGSSNNIITRCTISGSSSSGGGIVRFNNNTAVPCNDNTISYCTISSSNPANAAYCGIYFGGTTSTGSGNIIDNNTFINFGYHPIQKGSHAVSRFINFTISNNEFYNTVAVGQRHYYKAIYLDGTIGTTNIFNNKFHDLLVVFAEQSGSGIYAIHSTNTTGDILNIYNNVIYYDATVNHPLQAWYGIYVGITGTANISYNSISIAGSTTNGSIAQGIVKTGTGAANVKNNLVYISRTGSANSPLALSGTFTQTNNFTTDPGFTSPTNLIPTNYAVNAGVPIAGITTDIIGTTRNAVNPSIGAYEISHDLITINLTLFIEGLYSGAGTMSQAYDAAGPHWPAGVADHITVELRDAANYSTVIYSEDIALSTSGIAIFDVTPNYNGTYFITVKHRNSIETTTPTALSFSGSSVSHNFTSSAAQAYGNNLKESAGLFLIYSGDVNQDGSIDTGDMLPVDNDSFNYSSGYLSSDVNGDGLTDTGDMIYVDNNSAIYIGSMHP